MEAQQLYFDLQSIKPYSNILILGPRACGKTTLGVELLKQLHPFYNRGVFFGHKLDVLSQHFAQTISQEDITDTIITKIQACIENAHQDTQCSGLVLVYDLVRLQSCLSYQKLFCRFAFQSRHYKLTQIVITQNVVDFSASSIQRYIDYIFAFPNNSDFSRTLMCERLLRNNEKKQEFFDLTLRTKQYESIIMQIRSNKMDIHGSKKHNQQSMQVSNVEFPSQIACLFSDEEEAKIVSNRQSMNKTCEEICETIDEANAISGGFLGYLRTLVWQRI